MLEHPRMTRRGLERFLSKSREAGAKTTKLLDSALNGSSLTWEPGDKLRAYHVNFDGVDFQELGIEEVVVFNSSLKRANLTGLTVVPLGENSFDRAILKRSHVRYQRWSDGGDTFISADLEGSAIDGVQRSILTPVWRLNFTHANLSGSKFTDIYLTGCNLTQSDFSNATLNGVILILNNTSGANFSGVACSGGLFEVSRGGYRLQAPATIEGLTFSPLTKYNILGEHIGAYSVMTGE